VFQLVPGTSTGTALLNAKTGRVSASDRRGGGQARPRPVFARRWAGVHLDQILCALSRGLESIRETHGKGRFATVKGQDVGAAR